MITEKLRQDCEAIAEILGIERFYLTEGVYSAVEIIPMVDDRYRPKNRIEVFISYRHKDYYLVSKAEYPGMKFNRGEWTTHL